MAHCRTPLFALVRTWKIAHRVEKKGGKGGAWPSAQLGSRMVEEGPVSGDLCREKKKGKRKGGERRRSVFLFVLKIAVAAHSCGLEKARLSRAGAIIRKAPENKRKKRGKKVETLP